MMRGTASLIMISLLTIQPVFAQEVAPNRRLQDILTDIHHEAKRFSKSHQLPVVTAKECGQARSGENPTNDADRIRTVVLDTSIGTEVTITLRDGEVVVGKLAEVTGSYFRLKVPDGPYDEGSTTKEKFDFNEIRTFWSGPDPREIQSGKRVELRLVWGYKVEGRLTAVDDDGVIVDNRRFTFDEIVGVRKLGMRTIYKVLIPVGVFFGLMIFCAAGYCSQ